MPAASDDEEIGAGGAVEQRPGRRVVDEQTLELETRPVVDDGVDRLVELLTRPLLERVGVERHRHEAGGGSADDWFVPGMHGLDGGASSTPLLYLSLIHISEPTRPY